MARTPTPTATTAAPANTGAVTPGTTATPAIPAAAPAASTTAEQDRTATTAPSNASTDPTFTVSQQSMMAIKDRIAAEAPWIENPLNTQQSYTYHFRLFMTQDEDYLKNVKSDEGEIKPGDVFRALDDSPMRIIAESGVTAALNIQDVKIESLVGPNMESTNTSVTSFIINLTEPMGTSLVETMRNAANDLDIRNMDKAPYFLELTFKGYDSQGGIISTDASSGQSGLLADEYDNGGRWLYQIKITDIETELTASGSTYTITALPFNEFAFDPSCGTSPAGITITGATVKEMLTSLAEQLDKNWRVYFQYETYTFDFDIRLVEGDASDDPGQYKIVVPDETVEEVRNYRWEKGAGQPTMTVNLGMEVSTIVETIMASTQEAKAKSLAILIEAEATMTQDEAKEASTKRASTGVDLYRSARMFRIEPDVEITGFNYINNIYTKKITYCVWPFYTQAPVLSKTTAASARDPAVQSRLFHELIDRGFFRKKYDYLFTGMNTEVTRLDVRYNLAWAAVLPSLNEATSNTEQESVHARREDQETTPTTASTSPQGQSSADTPKPVPPPPSAEAGQAAGQDLLKIQDELQQKNAEIKAAQDADPDADVTALQAEANEIAGRLGTASAEVKRNSGAVAAARDASYERDRAVTASRRRGADKQYLEDLEGPIERTDRQTGFQPLPHDISFARAFNQGQNAIGSGFASPRGIGRGVYGAILEQMYGPLTTGLINIDMEIRGDPYWLSHSNIERRIHFKTGAPPLTPASRMANYAQGDNVFMLEFAYPFNLNDDGSINIRQDESGERIDKFTGLYRAVRVTNTFSGGEFRQTVKAQRFPLHDLARAMQFEGMHSDAGRISASEQEAARASENTSAAPGTAAARSARAQTVRNPSNSWQTILPGASGDDLIARTIVGEARNQSDAEQQALAHVIFNRMERKDATAREIVLQPYQFSPWNPSAGSTGQRPYLMNLSTSSAEYQKALSNVRAARTTADPTRGADHFWSGPAPVWSTRFATVRIPGFAHAFQNHNGAFPNPPTNTGR